VVAPTSELASGRPWSSSALERFVAIVLSTGRPSAPPICCETVVIPEPSPASAAGTSDIAIEERYERGADSSADGE
jgi:hypothetical protein